MSVASMSTTAYTARHKVLFGLAFLVPAIWTCIFILLYAYNIPIWDQWEFIPLLQKLYTNQSITLRDLWAQHNEHRILFPRLIMLGLASFSRWNIKYEIYVGFGLLAMTVFVVTVAIARLYHVRQGSQQVAANAGLSILMASVLLFSTNQNENLLWGWQIQIFLNVLCVVAGLFILTYYEKLRYAHLVAAVCFGVVATYSFANGVSYWLVGGIIIVARERKTKHFIAFCAIWVVMFALVVITYSYHFQHPTEHPSISYAVQHPAQFFGYILIYLGAPLIYLDVASHIQIWYGGLLGVSIVAITSYLLVKERLFFANRILFWHGLLLYAVLSAVITAVGRCGFGVYQAASSRYLTISNLFWLWPIIVFPFAIARFDFRLRVLFYPAYLAFLLLYIHYNFQNFSYAEKSNQLNTIKQGVLSRNDMTSATAPLIYPNVKALEKKNRFLQEYKLSFYQK